MLQAVNDTIPPLTWRDCYEDRGFRIGSSIVIGMHNAF
ncbi:hypothetical protein QIT80_gp34 (endogenous virus) [Pseudomonas phage phiAH14a]|uniref:Uncharacterized protein n=1 Tax=Pseudomonas phage phiAH14a TaxID=1805958 RepID=A0A1B0VMD3_9CAUD|nr:hypothetical protein QIT80_gp34 [Pseudomonas phage phiAH14a]AMW64494.1 hypothetical protein AH14a_p34 [Pseudomonas phage phiAH14a]